MRARNVPTTTRPGVNTVICIGREITRTRLVATGQFYPHHRKFSNHEFEGYAGRVPGRRSVYDIEAFPNYILFAFQDIDTGEVTQFIIDHTADQRDQLRQHVRGLDLLVGYNSAGYDNHLLDAALNGVPNARDKRIRRVGDCRAIWQLGHDIINGKVRRYGDPLLDRGERRKGSPLSVDLAAILKKNGGFPSLKALGVRHGYPTLQDLPIAPDTELTAEQKQIITKYNQHDLALTRLVLDVTAARLEMRRQLGDMYRMNLTSLSDPSLGEAVVVGCYERALNQQLDHEVDPDGGEPDYERVRSPAIGTEWHISGADFLPAFEFTNADTRNLYYRTVQQAFTWTVRESESGKRQLVAGHPDIASYVNIDGRTYSFGFGGLHSQDEAIIAASDDQHVLVEYGVASFYPAIIMAQRLAPRHLDRDIFLTVFDRLRQQRLQAKAAGDKVHAGGLKVAINAVFGKFSDAYSRLLDPRCGLSITTVGQFILLLAIERLAGIDGVSVLSANTDGLRLKIPRHQQDAVDQVVHRIAAQYHVPFEREEIDRYFAKAINDYLCIYTSGEAKGRGNAFNQDADKGAKRIVKRALIEFLARDVPVEDTVQACTDINQFIDYHRANSGFVLEDARGERYQHTNRWYESSESLGPVFNLNLATGKRSKLSSVVSARVANNLPDRFPPDLNHAYYVQAARQEIEAILHPKPSIAKIRAKKLDQLSADERTELAERQTTEEVDLARIAAQAQLIEAEHYRDDYLGKYKTNAWDSMTAVLIRMWHNQRLGLHKNELIWWMDSFDSTERYFNNPARPQKRKEILRYIDWLVDRTIPYQKELLPVDAEPAELTVNVLRDEPGGGKTRKALQMVVTSGPQVYWWAVNKINPLVAERQAELMALAEQHGSAVDYKAIHCDADGRGTMLMQVEQRMAEITGHPAKANTIFVTVITHKTLLDNDLGNVSGVLLVDEPVEVWEQRRFNFAKSFRTLRSLVEPQELPAGYDGDVNAQIEAGTQAVRLVLTDRGWEVYNDQEMERDTVHGSYRWLVRQAAKTSGRIYATVEQWNQLGQPGGGDIDVLALLHPSHLANFDQTWMMAAYFEQLIIYELWLALHPHVTWNFVELDDGWRRKTPLSERVTLHYVLEHRQISASYLEDARHCRAMAAAVSEFYSDAPFIWSTCQAAYETGYFAGLRHQVVGADGNTHQAYLNPKANGINCYQNVHGAAWLGTIKLPSSLLTMLRRLWPGDDARRMALVEYELYACLQFLARANSRRFDSADQVRYIVADQEQAAYVARMWGLPADRVSSLPMRPELKAELDDAAPKSGRKCTLTDDERRERRRQSNVRRMASRRAAMAVADGRNPGQAGRPKLAGRPQKCVG